MFYNTFKGLSNLRNYEIKAKKTIITRIKPQILREIQD